MKDSRLLPVITHPIQAIRESCLDWSLVHCSNTALTIGDQSPWSGGGGSDGVKASHLITKFSPSIIRTLMVWCSSSGDEADLGTWQGAVDLFKLKSGTSTTGAGLLLSSCLSSLCNLQCSPQILFCSEVIFITSKTSSWSASPRKHSFWSSSYKPGRREFKKMVLSVSESLSYHCRLGHHLRDEMASAVVLNQRENPCYQSLLTFPFWCQTTYYEWVWVGERQWL
jgi:hypothetical protein